MHYIFLGLAYCRFIYFFHKFKIFLVLFNIFILDEICRAYLKQFELTISHKESLRRMCDYEKNKKIWQ